MGVIQPCCFDDKKYKNGKRRGGGLTRLTKHSLNTNLNIPNSPSKLHKYKSIDDIKEEEPMNSNNTTTNNNSSSNKSNKNEPQNESSCFNEIIIRKHSRKLKTVSAKDNKKNTEKNIGRGKTKQMSQHQQSINDQKICDDFIKGELKGSGRFGNVYSGLGSSSGEMVAIKTFKNLNVDVKKK